MKNRYSFKTFSILLLVGLLIFPTTSFAANPSIGTSETVASVAAGTDDQTDVTTQTTANVAEVKAARTLTVGTLPVDTETTVIGTCTVTYATTTAGSPSEDANCTGGATILTTTGTADDIARTASEIAAALRTLTNVSDTGHGSLTVSGSGSDAIFTTTGTEASATAVTFTDGTSGDVTSTASTVGVIPVAQVNTITIAGTVDTGDVFTATIPTVGAVTYTVPSSDTTTTDIATGLNAAIQASAGYASQDFTSAASTNTVVLTAKVAGTGFIQTSSATNRSSVAQVVVFTPVNISSGWTFKIAINDTNYSYQQSSGDTLQLVVEGIRTLVDADSSVNCTEDNTTITCTAVSAGTVFTYSTDTIGPSSGGGVSYGCKDKNASNYEYFAQHKQSLCEYNASQVDVQQDLIYIVNKYREVILQAQSEGVIFPPEITALLNEPSSETITMSVRDLTLGIEGDDVRALQQILITADTGLFSRELARVGATGYFGSYTQNALSEYQKLNGILPYAGYFGLITRTQMKTAGREGLWW